MFLSHFNWGNKMYICYAQNGYIVSTASRQANTFVESPEKQFIDDHFKYYSLCDWTPGMKFMVIPERKDLVIPVFKSAENQQGGGYRRVKT